MSLTPSVEIGLRQDGGDVETGVGLDVGSGLVLTDALTGLSLDVRVRTLVVHQSAGFTEAGDVVLARDPTPSSPLGLTARLSPSWGGSAMSGAEALWQGQMAYGPGSHPVAGSGGRLDGEVGYGLPVGSRFVGMPRVGLVPSEYGRDYRVGYGLGVLDTESLRFELGVDARRRESPLQGGADAGVRGRVTLAGSHGAGTNQGRRPRDWIGSGSGAARTDAVWQGGSREGRLPAGARPVDRRSCSTACSTTRATSTSKSTTPTPTATPRSTSPPSAWSACGSAPASAACTAVLEPVLQRGRRAVNFRLIAEQWDRIGQSYAPFPAGHTTALATVGVAM